MFLSPESANLRITAVPLTRAAPNGFPDLPNQLFDFMETSAGVCPASATMRAPIGCNAQAGGHIAHLRDSFAFWWPPTSSSLCYIRLVASVTALGASLAHEQKGGRIHRFSHRPSSQLTRTPASRQHRPHHASLGELLSSWFTVSGGHRDQFRAAPLAHACKAARRLNAAHAEHVTYPVGVGISQADGARNLGSRQSALIGVGPGTGTSVPAPVW